MKHSSLMNGQDIVMQLEIDGDITTSDQTPVDSFGFSSRRGFECPRVGRVLGRKEHKR